MPNLPLRAGGAQHGDQLFRFLGAAGGEIEDRLPRERGAERAQQLGGGGVGLHAGDRYRARGDCCGGRGREGGAGLEEGSGFVGGAVPDGDRAAAREQSRGECGTHFAEADY